MPSQRFAKGLVSGMRQIDCPTCFIFERQQETVCEAIVLAFRTVIRPRLKINDLANFLGQRLKCCNDALDVFLTGSFVKCEENSVA